MRASFPQDRVTAAVAGGPLKDDEKRDDDQRGDHQQLVIVDIGDDLRLLRDHGIDGGGERIPELGNGRVLKDSIDGRDVLDDVGVIDLRVRRQQAVDHRDADARADVAREAEEPGTFRPLLR